MQRILVMAALMAAVLWPAQGKAATGRQTCQSVAPGKVGEEQRIALVMGNRIYDGGWEDLPAAIDNDADRRERKLKSLGFGVIRGQNLTREDMDYCTLKLRSAIGTMRGKSLVVVYYSGHGMGVAGQNYLAPADSRLPDDVKDLDRTLINVSTLVDFIGSSEGRTNLLFLDSCRNNEKYLKGQAGPCKGYPNPKQIGFAKLGLSAQTGTVIAYAVDPGRVASAAGGDGDTSLYTGMLLRNLETPGLSLMSALNRTILDVKEASDQTPWIEGDTSLLEPIVFTPVKVDPGDDNAWKQAQTENTATSYRRYEREFPNGAHLSEARATASALERLLQQTATLPPPPIRASEQPAKSPDSECDEITDASTASICREAYAGDAHAQFKFGFWWYQGTSGLTENKEKAVYWYTKGAAQGHAAAENNLAAIYGIGDGGVIKNEEKALELYESAARHGSNVALKNIAHYYELGLAGLQRNDSIALQYYRNSIKLGNAEANFDLGRFTEQGRGGIAQSDEEALAQYQKAAAAGDNYGAEAVKRMTAKMDRRKQVASFNSTLYNSLRDRIFFDYKNSNLTPPAKEMLRKIAVLLNEYPLVEVTLEGNTDERGAREYNLAHGERQVNSAKDFLVAEGVDSKRIKTLSYGEERPVTLGQNESAWGQNRRAVIVAR